MKKAAFEKKWKKEVGTATVNPNAIWDKLDAIERQSLVIRPPDSFTTKEYAAKRNHSVNMAQKILYRLHALGKVNRHKAEGGASVYWTVV